MDSNPIRWSDLSKYVHSKILLALCLTALGCAGRRVPFTQDLRENLHLTEEELKDLQYYLTHDLLLRRQESSGKKEIDPDHKLVVKKEKLIDEVVAKAGTLGIVTASSPLHVWVALKVPEKTISFVMYEENYAQGGGTARGQYCISGHMGNPANGEDVKTFYVYYDQKKFEVVKNSCLLIDEEFLYKLRKKREVLPGIKLQDVK